MAFTATLLKHATSGNERTLIYQVIADAASGVVNTPLGFIDGFAIGIQSMTTSNGKFRANLNITSGAQNGTVFISSIANGDQFFLTVYGRS